MKLFPLPLKFCNMKFNVHLLEALKNCVLITPRDSLSISISKKIKKDD